MTIRQTVSLGAIFLLPVLIQRVRDLGQLRPVLNLFQYFLCALFNCETKFLEKWLTRFGCSKWRPGPGSGARIPR